jgi:hypothetical protein
MSHVYGLIISTLFFILTHLTVLIVVKAVVHGESLCIILPLKVPTSLDICGAYSVDVTPP